jgi:putative ABC transport system permease protein
MSRRRSAAHAGQQAERRDPHARPQHPQAGLRSRARAAWPAVTGTGAAASATLGLLVLICAFVAVAVPRASLGYRTAVLQRTFAAVPAAQKTVLADGDLSGSGQGPLSIAQLEKARVHLAAGMHGAGLPLAGPAAQWQWSGLATGTNTLSGATAPALRRMAPPQMELLYRSTLPSQSALVAGSLPATLQQRPHSATFQVAVTTATAARLGLHVGSRLRMEGQTLVVTGIVRPVRPESAFWTVDPLAAEPRHTLLTVDGAPFWSTAAFVGRAEVQGMQAYLGAGPLHAQWSFPLDLRSVTADQAAGLQRSLQALSFLPALSSVSASVSSSEGSTSLNGAQASTSSPIAVTLSSGLTSVLPAFVATDDAVQRALSLLFVSLAVIAAVVVLLGARLVTLHRDREFSMMRARGASLRQLSLVALRGGAVVVLPAAAVAVAAGVAVTPGPASRLSWWLAGAIIAVALAGPPALAAWRHRTRRGAARSGAAPESRRRLAAARRWVADVTLVCAAVGGLIILRQQGLPPPGSIDLFTAAAPVLVAIPAAVLVMRGYPLVLRVLTRVTRRRRGVVMIVGLARGSAAAQAGVLPAFALVLAFAVAAFAGMARSAVAAANVAASWQTAGADATITAPEVGPGITAAAQRAIAGVPGVQRTAVVAVATATSGQGYNLPVAIVDPRSYAALTAATPLPRFPAGALARPVAPQARVPVLVSPTAKDVLHNGSSLYVAGRTMQVQVAGHPNSFLGVPSGGAFAVLPRWALGAQAPPLTAMAVVGQHLNTTTLIATAHRAVPGSQVTLRSQVLAGIAGAPLPHGGFVTFAQGAGAAAGLSLLVLVLTLVLSARSREMTLARLATMGIGPAQSRRITVVETLPAILAATVGGAACALALVPLVGPSVNLAAFTGTPVVVPLHANLMAIAATAVGLIVLAWVTLAVQSRLARSRRTTQALRVGE